VWERYCTPADLDEALALLAQYGAQARIVAGGTDLLLEIERGQRAPAVLIDITRIPGLDNVSLAHGIVHIGPLVTHNQVVASALLVEVAYPLARACWEVGAPQIRNRGTVAGNLLTASPANDTIAPLRALDARVTLRSRRGERCLPLADFFLGVRRTALAPDEMLVDISFPAAAPGERGTFIKLGLRQSQAISVVNVAALLAFDDGKVRRARLAYGSVAPTIVRAAAAAAFLAGKELDEATIHEAGRLAAAAVRPIDDIRAPGAYRSDMVDVLTERALRQLRDGCERSDWPEQPVLLSTVAFTVSSTASSTASSGQGTGGTVPGGRVHSAAADEPIELTVDGRRYAVRGAHGKTLLRVLREDLGLIGTKEGCGEGECGACTVHLDGMAVMACLVPAAAAHGRNVVTIEGLSRGEELDSLHPLQRAFIEADAIQCGYCSPGFIMTGAKLLEEVPNPTRAQIVQAISGNLCRCTGYVNIVRAIELAAQGSVALRRAPSRLAEAGQ
jgi:xanthine dehydrogenase iron-sulfur cluster and FAD-binding subunit A